MTELRTARCGGGCQRSAQFVRVTHHLDHQLFLIEALELRTHLTRLVPSVFYCAITQLPTTSPVIHTWTSSELRAETPWFRANPFYVPFKILYYCGPRMVTHLMYPYDISLSIFGPPQRSDKRRLLRDRWPFNFRTPRFVPVSIPQTLVFNVAPRTVSWSIASHFKYCFCARNHGVYPLFQFSHPLSCRLSLPNNFVYPF